jgi:hypothetical protein
MHCCPNCFGDQFLRIIITRQAEKIGKCDYCNTEAQPLISPPILFEVFETVFAAYQDDVAGSTPVDILKKEWHLFSSSPDEDHGLLLDHIMGAGFQLKTYKVDNSLGHLKVKEWEDFRSELKHRLRFFPDCGPNLDHLEELFEYLEVKLEPQSYYRARIQVTCPYSITEMGMPPDDICGNGRANPAGISFLYIASDAATALAEVRPHPGDTVSVGQFTLSSEKVVIDLRDPRGSITPFGKDEDMLRALRQDLVFLQKLSDDLAKPYQPRMAHLEYLPTQYLCEFIKKIGYSGVVYRSAVGEGINYVVFTNDDFVCTAISSIPVVAVKVITG